MLGRLLGIVVMVLALTGCVLQSKTPLIAADAGAPLLDSYGLTFVTYGLKDGQWRKDNDVFTFTRTGRHYVIREGGDELDVAFLPISGSWWLMQATEPGKMIAYGLVDAQPDELFIHTLDCKTLKDGGLHDADVSYEGDDCFLKPGADAPRLFAALAAEPRDRTSKMVPKR